VDKYHAWMNTMGGCNFPFGSLKELHFLELLHIYVMIPSSHEFHKIGILDETLVFPHDR